MVREAGGADSVNTCMCQSAPTSVIAKAFTRPTYLYLFTLGYSAGLWDTVGSSGVCQAVRQARSSRAVVGLVVDHLRAVFSALDSTHERRSSERHLSWSWHSKTPLAGQNSSAQSKQGDASRLGAPRLLLEHRDHWIDTAVHLSPKSCSPTPCTGGKKTWARA